MDRVSDSTAGMATTAGSVIRPRKRGSDMCDVCVLVMLPDELMDVALGGQPGPTSMNREMPASAPGSDCVLEEFSVSSAADGTSSAARRTSRAASRSASQFSLPPK